MKNLKIVTKLSLAFGIVIALVIVVGIAAVVSLGKVHDAMQDVTENGLPSVRYASAANTNASDIRLHEMLHISASGNEEMAKEEKMIATTKAGFNKNMEGFKKLLSSQEEKKTYEDYMAKWDEYMKVHEKVLQLSRDNKDKEAKALSLSEGTKTFGAADVIMDNMVEMNVKAANDSDKAGEATYNAARLLVIGLLVGALVIGILFAIVIARSITGPLHRMRDLLQDIAQGEGDLTRRLDDSSKDELGEVSRWFNVFVGKLHDIIASVANNTLQVASAANQLQASAEQIATGAEEVAAQASTVATASEEMSATSGEIAQNCVRAAEGGSAAGGTATNGAQVVNNTVQVMSSIADRVQETAQTITSLGERSDQIGQIIGTIEDIADQTNLLALNAAIEAARAGEQGRGFAVVADEVRALAERTTKATREIGEMIKAIQNETKGAVTAMEEGVREVQKGTDEAAKSGEALQAILEQINSVTMQINLVATAAEEQTATTAEISNNIYQITEVVGSTAKGAQESASAATQLAGTAEELRRIVGQFKL